MKGIFFIAGEMGTAKAELVQKACQILREQGKKVAHFKPVGNEEKCLYSLLAAQHLVVEGKKDELIQNVIDAYKTLEAQNDFVVCEGTNLITRDVFVENDINKMLAKYLCLPVALVMKKAESTLEASDIITRSFESDFIHVLAMVSDNQDLEFVLQSAERFDKPYLSTKMFEAWIAGQAKSDKQKIVLPEGECERILKAADILNRRQIVDVVILGKKDEVLGKSKELGLSLDNVEIINPETSELFNDYAATLYELRKAKGMTPEQAKEMMKDTAYFGTMMVYKGDADGMVSGAEHTTAHTIRPALQFVKTKPETNVVSGAFLMCFNGRLLVFSDCAVVPNPTAEQLSDIAVTTAQTARVFGLDPKVAFLSYGSGNSGSGPSVDIVKEAVRLTQERNVDFEFEGPIQFDAAINPVVAKTKLPNSSVAGKANVFIFPELNTGNCCYKAIQQTAGEECLAIGPVLQGLRKPVNDLSRGATVHDIVNTVAFTAIFSQKERERG